MGGDSINEKEDSTVQVIYISIYHFFVKKNQN